MAMYRDSRGHDAPASPETCSIHHDARGVWWVRIGHRNHRVAVSADATGRWSIQLDGASDVWNRHGLREQLMERMGLEEAGAAASKELRAPMPGKVIDVLVQEGQPVEEGEPVLVLEAMKMENVLRAGGDGVVASIHVEAGQAVEKEAVLVALEN